MVCSVDGYAQHTHAYCVAILYIVGMSSSTLTIAIHTLSIHRSSPSHPPVGCMGLRVLGYSTSRSGPWSSLWCTLFTVYNNLETHFVSYMLHVLYKHT